MSAYVYALLLISLLQGATCTVDYGELTGESLNEILRHVKSESEGYESSQIVRITTSPPVEETTVQPDPCYNVTCFNGGVCAALFDANKTDVFTCNCTSGFVGDRCQFRDPCVLKSALSRRCYNGGTCTVVFPQANSTNIIFAKPTYQCVCRRGHTGPNCASFDYCAIAPCQKGTACRNLDNGYTCDCPRGYRGTECKLDLDECAMEEPCQNEGVCVNTLGSYRCICPRGFKGPKCENAHIPCSDNPCKNGGKCCPGLDSTHLEHCDCPSGFGGLFCEQNINDCPGHSCQNGGKCVDKVDAYVCECPAGYEGQFCTDDVDECQQMPSVCENGGTCLNRIGNFSCLCTEGWEGVTCRERRDPCLHASCNAGICKASPNLTSFTCECTSGYTGKTCKFRDPCRYSSCSSSSYNCVQVPHPTLGDAGEPTHRCDYVGGRYDYG